MDLIQASNTGELAPVLEWWTEDPEPDQGSVTSRLTKECISVFKKTTKKLSMREAIPREMFQQFERSCFSLILWDSGYDVAQGGLDDVLAKSRTLRRLILKHLISIGMTLTDRQSACKLNSPYKV